MTTSENTRVCEFCHIRNAVQLVIDEWLCENCLEDWELFHSGYDPHKHEPSDAPLCD